MIAYLLLAIAIAGELVGTTFLKLSEGYTIPKYTILSIIAYAICFFSFSKSLKNINLSVAYATWSAVGLVITTLISIFLFQEKISIRGAVGITLIVVGTVLVNMYGTVK